MKWVQARDEPWRAHRLVSGDIEIACRDWSGTGPDLVLLHGLGPDQRSMAKLAAALTSRFRVITYDERGYGGSTTVGEWTFDAAVEDLNAVIDHYGLTDPIVAGHSLGGMIALMYGARHPEAPAVVNIDGWGPGRPEQYLDADPAVVRAFHDRTSQLVGHTPLGRIVGAIIRQLPAVKRHRDIGQQAITAVYELDVLALHRQVECPVLAFHCTAATGGLIRVMLGAEGTRLLRSYRRGLRPALDQLAEEHPNITVVELDAPHHVMSTDPALVAAHICGFADSPQPSASS